MGGRGSNSMDRLKAGSRTSSISQISALQKAQSVAEGALTRAHNRQVSAHAAVNLFDGDKSSKEYANIVAAMNKADDAYRKAVDKLSKAQSDLNIATEKAEAKTTGKWTRGTQTIADRQSRDMKGYASSDGKYFVYKDAGGRYRLYSITGRKTVSQSVGSDLTFNKLKDAQDYASELTSKRRRRKR